MPEIATPLIVIEEANPLVRVATCVPPVDPTVVLPNAMDVGLTETVPLAAVPVPVNATVCGLPLPESLIFNVALRAPVAVGVKTTYTLQLDDAASDERQVVLLYTLKSLVFEPVNVKLLIVIAVVFEFVSITAFGALVFPIATEAQLRLVGDTETAARQSSPVSAHAAIIPFTVKILHRLTENGAERILKAALRT